MQRLELAHFITPFMTMSKGAPLGLLTILINSRTCASVRPVWSIDPRQPRPAGAVVGEPRRTRRREPTVVGPAPARRARLLPGAPALLRSPGSIRVLELIFNQPLDGSVFGEYIQSLEGSHEHGKQHPWVEAPVPAPRWSAAPCASASPTPSAAPYAVNAPVGA